MWPRAAFVFIWRHGEYQMIAPAFAETMEEARTTSKVIAVLALSKVAEE